MRSSPARRTGASHAGRRRGPRRLARTRRGAGPHRGPSRGVPYVGLVASEIRGNAVKQSLDLSEEQRDRLHTPAGLEIGAETPEEIALSILAEIVALRPADAAARRLLPGEPERAGAARGRRRGRLPSRIRPRQPGRPPVEVALDPVCGMEVALSPASIQLERDGERFYFCSEGCRDTFAAEGAHGAAVS